MTLIDTLKSIGIPVAYGKFSTQQALPYLVYIGAGQENYTADNTFYKSENSYQIEYYFAKKNEAKEKAIEKALLDNGFLYEKTDDNYIESEDCYVIYYQI